MDLTDRLDVGLHRGIFRLPKPIESFVNRFSPIASVSPPTFVVPGRSADEGADWSEMIDRAKRASPSGTFACAFFPVNRKQPLTLFMARGALRNFTQMDYVYFDPATGSNSPLGNVGRQRPGERLLFSGSARCTSVTTGEWELRSIGQLLGLLYRSLR
jgi:hypothetical protein